MLRELFSDKLEALKNLEQDDCVAAIEKFFSNEELIWAGVIALTEELMSMQEK